MDLRSGWSYPAAQSAVRKALTDAGATVDALSLYSITDAKDREEIDSGRIRLVSAEWTGRRKYLWLYAIPSAHRSAAGAALSTGLPEAAAWLGNVHSRGDGWRMTRHRLDLVLDRGRLRIEERDGYFAPEGNSIGAV